MLNYICEVHILFYYEEMYKKKQSHYVLLLFTDLGCLGSYLGVHK